MKIVFIDMDGTVIEQNKILHEKDKEMMKKWQESGHKIAFNTGRNYQEALFCIETHGFPYDYLILNNGAHIVDVNGKEIWKKTISGEIGKKIIAHCLTIPDLWIFFYGGNSTIGYLNGDTYEHTAEGIVPTKEYDFIESYQQVESFDIFALNQWNHKVDVVLEIQSYIEKYYGEYATGCLNVEFLDVTPAGCSKGTGITKIKEIEGNEVETYAIGDSFNDLSMFAVADHAYTFHRVSEDIAQHTDAQVAYVYELMESILQ